MLDKSPDLLISRLLTKLEADLEIEFSADLERLISPKLAGFATANLGKLNSVPLTKYPTSTVQTLESFFTKNGDQFLYNRSRNPASSWVSASGDDFLDSYARVLRNADETNRFGLLSIEFSFYENFAIRQPEQLDELLAWCDTILGDMARSLEDKIASETARMLTGLLVENDRISELCQQTIVNRLETYEMLTDANFWLASPVNRRVFWYDVDGSPTPIFTLRSSVKPYAAAMREVKFKRAINVLIGNDDVSEGLVCQALAVLTSAVTAGSTLEAETKNILTENLRKRLTAAIQSPAASMSMLQTPLALHSVTEPQFKNSNSPFKPFDIEEQNSDYAAANEVILILNLVAALELQESLKQQIKELHETIEPMVAKKGPVTLNADIAWLDEVVGNTERTVAYVWYLQTGTLLGESYVALVSEGYQLREAEYERKMRFVQPGDTLAIHIPGVLPRSGEPPVIQAGNSQPVSGFPVAVSAQGTIQLPMIGRLEVKDLELDDVRQKIGEIFVAGGVLQAQATDLVSVDFLLREGQNVELRNIAGNSSVTVPPN